MELQAKQPSGDFLLHAGGEAEQRAAIKAQGEETCALMGRK